MTNTFFQKTINGEAILKIMKDLETTEDYIFLKNNNFTIADYRAFINCLKEYYKNGEVLTLFENVSKAFQVYGFDVSMSNDGVNYLIQ